MKTTCTHHPWNACRTSIWLLWQHFIQNNR